MQWLIDIVLEAMRDEGFLQDGDSPTFNDLNVTGDLNIAGELEGSRHSILFTHTGGTSTQSLFAGVVEMASGKGAVMPRSGSIVGISVSFNITASTTFDAFAIARINGSGGFGVNCGLTIVNDQEVVGTQARGIDTFAAGDRIDVIFGGKALDWDEVIAIVEVQYDT